MPRQITVTFEDGSQRIYQNAPDNITPDQVIARASKESGKKVASLDGGANKSRAPVVAPAPAPQIKPPASLAARQPAPPPRQTIQPPPRLAAPQGAIRPPASLASQRPATYAQALGKTIDPIVPKSRVTPTQWRDNVGGAVARVGVPVVQEILKSPNLISPAGVINAAQAGSDAAVSALVDDATNTFVRRNVAQGALPAAGGFAGFGAGAQVGQRLTRPLSKIPRVGPLIYGGGTIIGGLTGAMLGSTATTAVQNTALDALPTDVTQPLGLDAETRNADMQQRPYATAITRALPGFAFGVPGVTRLPVRTGAPAFERVFANPVTGAAAGAAIGGATDAGMQYATTGEIDPAMVGISAVLGASQNRNTRLGDVVGGIGARAAGATLDGVNAIYNKAWSEFETRRAQATGADMQAKHGFATAPETVQDGNWRYDDDGNIANPDGRPFAFETPIEAAKWAARNKMGDHELALAESGQDGSTRYIWRRYSNAEPSAGMARAPAGDVEVSGQVPAVAPEPAAPNPAPLPEASAGVQGASQPAVSSPAPAGAPVASLEAGFTGPSDPRLSSLDPSSVRASKVRYTISQEASAAAEGTEFSDDTRGEGMMDNASPRKRFINGYMTAIEGRPLPASFFTEKGRPQLAGYQAGLAKVMDQAQSAPVAVEPARPITPPIAIGKAAKARVPSTMQKVDTQFELHDLSNVRFAEGQLQNRDRTRAQTQDFLKNFVNTFDPEALGQDNSTDRGAPIINKDNVILSGNGRMMGLEQIYAGHPELAEAYKQFLRSEGYNVDGIERPVLVRRLTSDVDERQFVVGSNDDDKAALSAPEQARQDAADILTPEVMAQFAGGDILLARNDAFVTAFLSKLSAKQRGDAMDKNGKVSTGTITRINNALLHRAYGGSGDTSSSFMSKVMERTDDDSKTLTGALMMAAPDWIKFQQEIAAGGVDPKYDITPKLLEAIAMVSDIKARDLSVAGYLRMEDMVSPMDPFVKDMLLAFHNDKITRFKSKKDIAELLTAYAERAADQQAGEDMFGLAPTPSAQEVWRATDSELRNQGADNQAQLVGLEDRASSTPATRRQSAAMFDMVEEVGAEAPARERAPAAAEEVSLEDGSTVTSQDKGGYQPTVVEASFTNRRSVYDSAIEGTGIPKEQFELLKPEIQARKLIDAMQQRFSIKVVIAPDLQLRMAIDQILDGYQAMIGMARILGVSERAMGFGGELTLKLQKKGRFHGLFTTNGDTNVIVLPRRSNSFAHEFAHAIDYHVAGKIGGELMSGGVTGMVRSGEAYQIPTNLRDAWVNLTAAMFHDNADVAAKIGVLEARIAKTKSDKQKAAFQKQIDNLVAGASKSRTGRTKFYEGALSLDKNQKAYWTKPTEMFARAFEAYVSQQLEFNGFGTEFAGKGNDNYLSTQEEQFRKAYPKEQDRYAIFEAIENLMAVLHREAVISGDSPVNWPEVQQAADLAAKPDAVREAMREGQRKGRKWWQAIADAERESIAAWKHNRQVGKDKEALRASPPVRFLQQLNNLRSFIFDATSDVIKMIGERHNSKAVREIHDIFGFDTGGDRPVGRVWHRTIDMAVNKHLNQVAAEIENSRFMAGMGPGKTVKKMTLAEERELKQLIYGTHSDPANADPDLVKIAGIIRKVQDDVWYELNTALGGKVGYVQNIGYLNDRYDMGLVLNDMDGFKAAAVEEYGDVFDRDFGADAKEILASEEKLTEFVDEAAQYKVGKLKELRKAIKDGDPDPDMVDEMRDELRAKWAAVKAQNHLNAVVGGTNFSSASPSLGDDFTNKRVFTAKSRERFADFYISNPIEAVVDYVQSATRRTEWAKRFGADGEKLKDLQRRMTDEGVPASDQDLVMHLIDRTTGRYIRQGFLANPTVLNILGFLKMRAAVTMLGRATMVSLAEPQIAGVISGDPTLGTQLHGQTWGTVFGSAKGKERMRWAQTYGLIRNAMLDAYIMNDRYGHLNGQATRWDRITAAMFRNSGLNHITNAGKATVAYNGGHALLLHMSDDLINGSTAVAREASKRMRELGITDPETFAKEMIALGEQRPDADKTESAWGYEYLTAVERFMSMTVADPTLADRSPLANNPLASYSAFSITAFMQGSYKNITQRIFRYMMNRMGDKEYGAAGRYFFGMAAAYSLYVLMQFLYVSARNEMMNRERVNEWRRKGTYTEETIKQAAAYSVAVGWADPVYNTFTGVKYQRDWYSAVFGAYMGNDVQMIGDLIFKPLASNSDRTLNAERNAAKAFYGLFVAPFASYLTTALPSGMITTPVAGVTNALATSRTAQSAFSDVTVASKEDAKKLRPLTPEEKLQKAKERQEEKLRELRGE